MVIVNNDGWSVLQALEVNLIKNMKLEVPLVKKVRLTGSLNFISEKYKKTKCNLFGIRVKATASNGSTFDAITDNRGAFTFICL